MPRRSLGALGACVLIAPTFQAATVGAQEVSGPLEEVVVTARQRQESLQEVPISISTLSGSELGDLRINSLQGIEYSMPNLVFGETGTSGETFVGIRGIGDFSRNIGFDTRVGVYIDGVFVGQSLAVDQGLADIAQVEVLRGPQGTLFGKNSSAGIINVTTYQPDPGQTSVWVQAGAGNFDNTYGSGTLNLPLGSNTAFRLSAAIQEQDGYVANLATGKDVMSNNHRQARARLGAQPSEALGVILSFDVREQNNDILFLEPDAAYENTAGDPAAAGRFSVSQDGPLIDENDSWGAGLNFDYELAGGYVVTSITGYRDSDRKVGSDEDATAAYALHVEFFQDEFSHFTQELRVASPAEERFRYVAGLYYFDQQGEQFRDVVLGPAFGAPAGTLAARSDSTVDTSSWAVFVNADLELTSRLTASGGLRYTEEEKEADLSQTTLPAFGLANFDRYVDSIDDSYVTATASLRYAFSDRAQSYLAWSRGHKSGGWNVDFVATVDDLRFEEETVDSIELGLKSDLLDGRLRLNAAAFHAEYDDFQVFQFQFTGTTTNLIVSNAAAVTTEGFEVEGVAQLGEAFEISYGVGYVRAEFDDFPGGAIDDSGQAVNVAGNRLPRAPEVTSSLTARYRFDLGAVDGTAQVNWTYRDDQYFNPDNRERSAQNGYSLLNASLDLAFSERWRLAIWGRNLTDETYRTNAGVSFLGVPFSLYARPRTYGLDVSYSFERRR
jgi:iron complex outermembrane receptor protein